MAVPPEQVNEIKQIIQQHLSQETVQNKLKSLLPDLKMNPGSRDARTALCRSDLVKHLKESGAIDSIISDIEQVKNNNSFRRDMAAVPSECEKKRKLTNMMDNGELPAAGNSQLCFKVRGGRAFLDHLLQQQIQSTFTLHILFNGQRVKSKRVQCTCDPEFNEEFVFDLKKSQGSEGRLLEASLLSITDKLNLVLTRTNSFGATFLVSTHLFEWRQVLTMDRQVTSIDLMGAGKMPVGLLEVELYVNPRPSKLLTRDIIEEQCKQELRLFKENERRFLLYASNWWQEFKEIREDLKDRMVTIFVQDENSERRPVCSIVRPIRANRLLNTPREAARFVGLIPVGKSESIGQAMVQEKWTSMHAFLCCNKGESMDHAVLLCSLLLGFGLDAYVCVGTKSKGDFHVWVITISCSGVFTFWESQTGETYLHKPIQISDFPHSKHPYPYRTVGCVFSHKSFYANIQPSNAVEVCDFVLNDRTRWKPMSPDALLWLYESPCRPLWTPFCHLKRNPIDPINKSNILEAQLRHLITIQRQTEGLTTQWDDQLSYLLSSRLHYFENERITGNCSGTQEFKDALQQMMLDEQEFNGFPIQQKHLNMHLLFQESMKSGKCQQIIRCRGDNVRLAVSVCVFPYPEDVCATWAMYACIYHRVA